MFEGGYEILFPFLKCFFAPCDLLVMVGNPDGIWMKLSGIWPLVICILGRLAVASGRMLGSQGLGRFAQVLAQQGKARRHGYQRCKKYQVRDQKFLSKDSQHIKALSVAVLRKGFNSELIA